MNSLRSRLDEKEMIMAHQDEQLNSMSTDKSKRSGEVNELKEIIDLKERKVAVLQKKVRSRILSYIFIFAPFRLCQFEGVLAQWELFASFEGKNPGWKIVHIRVLSQGQDMTFVLMTEMTLCFCGRREVALLRYSWQIISISEKWVDFLQ